MLLKLLDRATDSVANEAANNRAKDAKYRHGHKYPQDRIRPGIADVVPIDEVPAVGGVVYAHVEADERGGKPNTCAENTAYDNTSNYHTAFHNPMRRQRQFTVKRSAVPPKCAVRDGVELLVLAAGDPVANVASKGHAKDAKYPQGRNKYSKATESLLPAEYAHFVSEKHGGNPNTCTENTESDNTSKHHDELQYLYLGHHNPMRSQCQFTIKRPEKEAV